MPRPPNASDRRRRARSPDAARPPESSPCVRAWRRWSLTAARCATM